MTKIPKKIFNTEHWGVTTAESRYGKLKQPDTRPRESSYPQFRQDQSRDFGDVSKSWITGGKGSKESAEAMPNFDHGKHGKKR